ncbi:MAG: PaaI family thioesterase [Dehalococcoidales bacterium]|nr:PaaI family thioesterase [Dehalococcoidales bacterium]
MATIPRVILNTDLNEGFCFGCGQNNPIGMKLRFTRDGETIRTEFTPDRMHQGWPGLVHGGILYCLLDEVMSNMAYATGNTCVTASIEIRQRQPVEVEVPLVITAWITRHRKKVIDTAGKVTLKDGTVIAEATAKQFIAENHTGQVDKVKEKRRHV